MSSEERHLVVHFNDGTKMAFEFPRQADLHAVSAKLDEVVRYDQLTVEADGTLILIPLSSVKYAQLVPAPKALPGTVIKGARLV